MRAAIVLGLCTALAATPAHAESARDILVNAAYAAPDKATALRRINLALATANAALKRDPRDNGARLQSGLAISYRGALNRSRSDVVAARRLIEAAVAADPRDAEAQMALAGWHLGAIIELGSMVARAALGARREIGNKALERSLLLGGDHPSFPALAALHRIQLDPSDVAGARRLAEEATREPASTLMDRLMQKQASILLASLRKGNGKAAAATAKALMPFGRVDP